MTALYFIWEMVGLGGAHELQIVENFCNLVCECLKICATSTAALTTGGAGIGKIQENSHSVRNFMLAILVIFPIFISRGHRTKIIKSTLPT